MAYIEKGTRQVHEVIPMENIMLVDVTDGSGSRRILRVIGARGKFKVDHNFDPEKVVPAPSWLSKQLEQHQEQIRPLNPSDIPEQRVDPLGA